MSRLEVTRGEENRFERRIHLPIPEISWDISVLEFRVMPHGDHAEKPLILKSSRTAPSGVELIDEEHARIVLDPSDTLNLPITESHFDWSLELQLGAMNVFVLDSGALDTV